MKIKLRKIVENSILPLIIGIFNLIFFRDQLFFSITYLPYIIVPLFSAVIYGSFYGYYTLILEILLAAGPLPWLISFLHPVKFSLGSWYGNINSDLLIIVPLEILLVYIFSLGHTWAERTKRRIKKRFSELSKENLQLKKLSTAQAEVSRELEERVYRQKEAITSMYAQIQKMYTLDLDQAFDVLLETIQIFTRASRLSIYKASENGDKLVHEKSLSEEGILPVIPMDESLEGWVHRNNRFFSIRMVLEYENLNRLDQGRSIMIFPIHVNNKPWGILNVEEMPFIKYNEYTEQLLEIIIHLAETALSRAIDYRNLTGQQTFNPDTGLLVYNHFLQVFDEELIRVHLGKSLFSFVVLEIMNILDPEEIKAVLPRMLPPISELIRGKGEIFHYREDNQIAVILPSIDLDGVSLFCLDLLEAVNRVSVKKDGNEINIEAVVGFAHSEKEDTRETLMEKAEKLLELQKGLAI